MTALAARNMAIECLVDVFGEAEADGFQQAQNTHEEWLNGESNILKLLPGGSGFIMTIGGHKIKIYASIIEESK